MIDGYEHTLVKIYNANTESEALKLLRDLSKLMKNVNITQGKQNFNLFFDSNLETKERKPVPKKNLL